MQENLTTKDLKRVLGFGDLMGAAVGQIIGAGIMSLMGVAILMTGRSTVLAFIAAAILVIGTTIPGIFISGTLRLRGGDYTQAALLGGTTFGGITMFLSFFSNVSLSMYALSFADYIFRFIPGVNSRLIAALILTLFWLLNMFGIDKFSKVQNVIVIIMCVALGLFAVFGIGKVQPGFFGPGFMSGGIMGFLQASALLTFATGGAFIIVNLSGESKNPTKHIPVVLILSTVLVAVLYGFMAIVAAGVLPVDQVAGKPLTQVAETILPTPLFIFFIFGGACFALISTLNSQLASAPKPMLQASVDGWLPKQFAYLHPRFKTPMVWLTIFYVLGLIPIITGLNIAEVASMAIISVNAFRTVIGFLLFRLPKVTPNEWKQSKFKTSMSVLYIVAFISLICGAVTIILMITTSSPLMVGLNVGMLAVSIIYSVIMKNKVKMEISYEAQ